MTSRALAGGGPDRVYEYEEDGRVLRVRWEPRESGTTLELSSSTWSEPAGEPMSEEARERARRAIGKLARKDGIRLIVEDVEGTPVVRQWDRTSPFVLNVHDDGRLEYMELHHTLRLRFRPDFDANPAHAAVELPEEPEWTVPAGEPIGAKHFERIRERLTRAGPDDMDIGRSRGWRIVFG